MVRALRAPTLQAVTSHVNAFGSICRLLDPALR